MPGILHAALIGSYGPPDDLPDFPVLAANTNFSSTGGSSFDVTLPSGIAAGDRLIVFLSGARGDRPFNTPDGWTELAQPTAGSGSSGHRMIILTRVADGSEGSTVTVTSSGTQNAAAAISCRITGWSGTPEITGGSGTNSDTQDPPSISPSWGAERTLFLTAMGCSQARSWVSGPSGWTPLTGATGGSANTDDSARIEVSWLQDALASADPGAWTSSASSTGYTTVTVAIKHA